MTKNFTDCKYIFEYSIFNLIFLFFINKGEKVNIKSLFISGITNPSLSTKNVEQKKISMVWIFYSKFQGVTTKVFNVIYLNTKFARYNYNKDVY